MGLILIADNSAPERQRLHQIMKSQDHIVVEAENSTYCLEIIQVHRLDGALINPFLSKIDKFELELLKALQNRQIPTIVITESQEQQVHQQCLEYGVFVVLGKFPSAFELEQTMNAALGLKPLPQSVSNLTANQASSSSKKDNFDNSGELLSINSFKNLVALGIEQAQETLNELTDSPINFQPPLLETMTPESLLEQLQTILGSEPISVAQLPFSGGFAGTSQLFFLTDSAAVLTEALTGEKPGSDEFNQAKEEMLTEIGNIVLNGIMGAMSNAMTSSLEFSVPTYVEDKIENLLRSHCLDDQATILLAQAGFAIADLQVTGDIILFFQVD